jgi:deazaflavin-dependent oxidoreductase (nitroreductase family)
MNAEHDRWLYRLKRWMYPDNRPNKVARFLNSVSAAQFGAGFLAPRRAVTLEVPGRRSGSTVSCPLVLVEHEGDRYLVSMLGRDVNWVRNVRANGGFAVLRRRGAEPVRLVEIDPAVRPMILRRYLDLAPGARPHVPVDRHAPLEEFARIADRFPVFLVTRARSAVPVA